MEPDEVLQGIAQEVAVCDKCGLSNTRKNSVPGEGPAAAEMMLIGEGPGFYENEQGRPFVGAAGNFLNELLSKAGVSRPDVFITNVVKCRPPENRDPLPEELLACGAYLDRQIAAIKPLIIVTLGRFSMGRFMPNARISSVHGRASWINNRLIVAMYHPAAALHQSALRPELEKDFARLPQYIEEARKKIASQSASSASSPPPKEDPKQLSLF